MPVHQIVIPEALATQPTWLKLVVQLALSTVSAFIATNTKLTVAQRNALQELITAGEKVEALL